MATSNVFQPKTATFLPTPEPKDKEEAPQPKIAEPKSADVFKPKPNIFNTTSATASLFTLAPKELGKEEGTF